jgi:hypothetical protein
MSDAKPLSEYKYYEKVEYHIAYGAMIDAARHRGTLTYQEIAEITGLPTQGNLMAHEVGELLGAVSANEVSRGRPMLSAIVVSVRGKPSEGFFNFARDLGRLADDSQEAEDRFWEEEKRVVYATWHKEFKKR